MYNIVKVKAVCKMTFWEESKNLVVDSKGSKSYVFYNQNAIRTQGILSLVTRSNWRQYKYENVI